MIPVFAQMRCLEGNTSEFADKIALNAMHWTYSEFDLSPKIDVRDGQEVDR